MTSNIKNPPIHPITGKPYTLPTKQGSHGEVSPFTPNTYAFERGYAPPFTFVQDQINGVPISDNRFDELFQSLAEQVNLSLSITGNNSMLSALNMSNNKVINMGAPSVATDGANKRYVDDAISSGNSTQYNNARSYPIGSRVWAMVDLSALPAPYNTQIYVQYYIAVAFVPSGLVNAEPTIDNGTYWMNDGVPSGVEMSFRQVNPPKGFLIEDGTLDLTLYPQLNRLRTALGITNQGNLKGLFIRYDSSYGTAVYANARHNSVGITSNWQIGVHHHTLGVPANYTGSPGATGTALAYNRTTQDTSGVVVEGNGAVGNDLAPMYGVRLPIIKI
jgi:hypothetical protein